MKTITSNQKEWGFVPVPDDANEVHIHAIIRKAAKESGIKIDTLRIHSDTSTMTEELAMEVVDKVEGYNHFTEKFLTHRWILFLRSYNPTISPDDLLYWKN